MKNGDQTLIRGFLGRERDRIDLPSSGKSYACQYITEIKHNILKLFINNFLMNNERRPNPIENLLKIIILTTCRHQD